MAGMLAQASSERRTIGCRDAAGISVEAAIGLDLRIVMLPPNLAFLDELGQDHVASIASSATERAKQR